MEPIKNRYDFIYLFDVKDGNPNGDPDAGNMPRIDAETGEGLVTDVCLKRKVRNYVQTIKEAIPPYDIFIKEGSVLNDTIASTTKDTKSTNEARAGMCKRFYDVRTFGAVMSTGNKNAKNAGQVRGPIQLTFARSISPIVTAGHAITRMAVTKTEDANKEKTMGRKYTVPYGLYLTHGYISANLAKQTGFSEEDLRLFWDALKNMFDIDHSAARGMMCPRRLIVFKHDSELGNAPSYKLFELVHITQKNPGQPPRSFDDYDVTIDADKVPAGIEILNLI